MPNNDTTADQLVGKEMADILRKCPPDLLMKLAELGACPTPRQYYIYMNTMSPKHLDLLVRLGLMQHNGVDLVPEAKLSEVAQAARTIHVHLIRVIGGDVMANFLA